MKNISLSMKNFILDILFPPHCLNCQKEGDYLCQDCQSLIEILEDQYCPVCKKRIAPTFNYTINCGVITRSKATGLLSEKIKRGGVCQECKHKTKLSGLFAAAPYQNLIVKKIINQFKYPPLVKDLAKPLSSLIITHFQLLGLEPNFSNFFIIPVPLFKKRLRERGFNQAEEISKELSKALGIPLANDVLIKIKDTLPQVELSGKEREENTKGAFSIKNFTRPSFQRKFGRVGKILLVDDVYTTGSTMSECARVLKEAGAKEVWGVVAARE